MSASRHLLLSVIRPSIEYGSEVWEGNKSQAGSLESIIGASFSEPHLDELAGAFLWYIYIYICIHGQSIWSRVGPVNAQRANVRPAE